MSALSTSLGPIIDISAPILPGMASWEDRFPPEVRWHSRHRPGERTAHSSWLLNSHTGTHVDAPYHHLAGGARIGGQSLAPLIGRCRVAEVAAPTGTIEAAEIDALQPQPQERLLLRTPAPARAGESFDPHFRALSGAAAERLVTAGVALIGIDAPSIEPFGSTDRAVHHTLLGADVTVVEGLVLHHVDPGEYLLICLPLPLAEAEASPSRAVLLPL
ncbi:kynurenine formamidase [Occultella glacieicola]|uniref:Kynurenine formamidase n=2 Tax=Occultella TaxID=2828348 RepID=A0A7M4DQR3_9MICO|nr:MULTISPECIES: cyclase family protein [Occultella]TDE89681.1 kynurenine formamidase [Occultella glacieicola]VZO39807.1 Kynurenine formamidase [Occultella aeris]